MDNSFEVGDIIVPSDRYLTGDTRREILEVGDTHYTLQFLTGRRLIVKWPIHGVDGDHKLYIKEV